MMTSKGIARNEFKVMKIFNSGTLDPWEVGVREMENSSLSLPSESAISLLKCREQKQIVREQQAQKINWWPKLFKIVDAHQ